MKKLVSVLLVLCMLISAMPVFAADANVEKALIAVKTKINIREELTKFEYSQSTYDNSVRYDFMWHDEDYANQMSVSCDMEGNIVSYHSYKDADYSDSRKLISYTVSDGKVLAEEFVKKAFPEYFENEVDTLKLNEKYTNNSYSGRFKTFTFGFERIYNGEKVESNFVNVRVRATKEQIYVQSLSAALDENAKFESEAVCNITVDEYVGKFPIEIYYATDYSGEEEKVNLFYSVEKGFVSRVDGEILTQKYFDRYEETARDEAMETTMATGSANKNMLTDAEIKALEEVESLVKVSEVEEAVRDLEILGITDDMAVVSTNTNKYDKTYVVQFALQGDERRTSVTYNGETGVITRIYTYRTKYDKEVLSENSDNSNHPVPQEDVKTMAKALSGEKMEETEVVFTEGNMTATRFVNNVKFPENRITATYSKEENIVTSYSLVWTDDVSDFPNPEEAIGVEKAKGIIFEIEPLYNTLLKTENGYTPATSINKAVKINAVTGENTYSEKEKLQYTDIDSHWAKDAISILWEHDIYIEGDKFKPDEAIKQSEMILLFSACRDTGIIPLYWKNDYIAEFAAENGYVEEADSDKLMTRKEGFEAFINILGYGDIAKFDIYKSSYNDLEANGSAEMLKAMGILIGDSARGDDNLTRAEAAVMVYRYLSK